MGLIDPECDAVASAFSRRDLRGRLPFASRRDDPMFKKAGSSFDLKNIREYLPADDPRRIDWKLYGRTDRYFVKEFNEEENDGIAILLDSSASMGLLSGRLGRTIAASLAYIVLRLGMSVSLFACDATLRRDKADCKASRDIGRALSFLEGQADEGGTRLASAILGVRKRSAFMKLFVISDFADLDFDPARRLFARTFYIRIRRPFAEMAPPSGGELEARDPETRKTLSFPWDAVTASLFARRERELDERLGKAARGSGFYRAIGAGEGRAELYWEALEKLHA